MRISRIRTGTGADFAVENERGKWVPLSSMGYVLPDTASVIANRDGIFAALRRGAGQEYQGEIRFHSPVVRPSKVLAIGLNYMDHVRETKSTAPERPILFAKFPNALNGPYDPIVLDPELTEMGDYEVELAVVIGERTRSVREENALARVFAYAVANDVSSRDWQRRDRQWARSKSFDTFCPIGPWLTTADEVADPQALRIQSRVNGELRQDSSTAEMIFSVAHLIHFLARGMTLEPGDVILTGTPHGVGFALDPPRFLQHGDVVRCEIEGLGHLENELVPPVAGADG